MTVAVQWAFLAARKKKEKIHSIWEQKTRCRTSGSGDKATPDSPSSISNTKNAHVLAELNRSGETVSDFPHLKGHVDGYISNLVDVWQRPSVVLTPVGSQLQILSLLELQLQTQQGEMRGGNSSRQHEINKNNIYFTIVLKDLCADVQCRHRGTRNTWIQSVRAAGTHLVLWWGDTFRWRQMFDYLFILFYLNTLRTTQDKISILFFNRTFYQ